MTPGTDLEFNLSRDPWIPVAFLDGTARLVSLSEAFERGDAIRDLAVAPHERIALMRLLICVAQACVENPDAADAGSVQQKNAPPYLRQWEASFELFGEGPRFLQNRTGKVETMRASKLFLELASGNNPTLLDHAGGSKRAFPPAALALALLTFQNFSPLVGRGFTGRGPCVDRNALHVFHRGETLSQLILRNCLLHHAWEGEWGRPLWELPPSLAAKANDLAVRNATHTYVGRLLPLTRAIWLETNRREFVLDNGLDYPAFPAWREPTCAEKMIKKGKNAEEPILISASLARGVWRELDSLLAHSPGSAAPPLTLRRLPEGNAALWTGGMVTDYKAKVEDLAESQFSGDRTIPRGLLLDATMRGWYRGGIEAAERWSFALSKAITAFGSYRLPRRSHRRRPLKMDEKMRTGLREDALRRFWAAAEEALPLLFDLLRALDANPEFLRKDDRDFKVDDPDAPSAWHRALRQAALHAYAMVAPHQEGRSLMARVAAEKSLHLSSKVKKSKQPVRA